MPYKTRREAGRCLSDALAEYAGTDTVVVGITRGGVVVADEIARMLGLPLDVLVVHKIPHDGDTYAHIGAVAEPDHVVVNHAEKRRLEVTQGWLREATAQAVRDIDRRTVAYRRAGQRRDLAGQRVIAVDDSAATGTTLRAAIRAIQAMAPREIIVALPVAPPRLMAALQQEVDRVVCLRSPTDLIMQGIHYPVAGEVSDDDIRHLLEQAHPATALMPL